MGFFSKDKLEEGVIRELRSFNMPNEDKIREILLCKIKQDEPDARFILESLGTCRLFISGTWEKRRNLKIEKLLKLTKNNMLNGKKTFIVAGLMAVFAIIGLALDLMPAEQAGALFLEALAIAGIREALRNK